MLAVPNCYQHLAVAYIRRIGSPDPAVVLAPAGLVHPESARRRPAQVELVLQGIALRIRGDCCPPDPASCKLRCRPIGEEHIHSRRPVGAGQGEGNGLLDVEAVRSGVLAVSYPDLNLICSRRIADGVPGPDVVCRVAGISLSLAAPVRSRRT